MDLSFLDKSTGVTPLLVRLYDSHKIYGLAKDKKPVARMELVSAVTELLEVDLSPRESELVADVMVALMRQAEKDLRAALSEKLSAVADAPLRLILHLASDDVDVASPILQSSPVLSDLDLIYIIKSKTPAYWVEIAKRKQLNDQVINTLANTRDFRTALTLAKNENIVLTENAINVLADLAKDKDDLAKPLLRREEVPVEIASMLYKYVGQEIKNYILQNYELEGSQLAEAMDDIMLDLQNSGHESDILPSESMVSSAERFGGKGLLTVNLMLSTLKRGQFKEFVAQFAKFSGLDPLIVAEIIMQPKGQGLAIACKAFGIEKSEFVTIFLLTSKIRRKDGSSVSPDDIQKAVQYFGKINEKLARDIIFNSIAGPSK